MTATMLETAVHALRAGQAVVFPTDTVYGLGVAVRFAESPQLLFDIKQRSSEKPVAWLVSSSDDLTEYGRDVPEYAFDLAKAFWPGGLTLVVQAGPSVPAAFASQAGTIGLRMPGNELTRRLIRDAGCPLATTSANLSTHPAPTRASEVDPQIVEQVPAVLADGGSTAIGVASTVIDCAGSVPVVLRTGSVSPDDVAQVTGLVPQVKG